MLAASCRDSIFQLFNSPFTECQSFNFSFFILQTGETLVFVGKFGLYSCFFAFVLGVRPYKCKYEECDKAFLQLSNLQYHHHNHHKETTPTIHVPPEAETQHHNHHKDAMPTIHVPPDAETQHHNHHKDAMPTIHVPPEAETQHHNQHKDVTPTIHVPPDAETHHYNHHKDATPTIHVPPEAETQGQGHHQHIPKAEMHGWVGYHSNNG